VWLFITETTSLSPTHFCHSFCVILRAATVVVYFVQYKPTVNKVRRIAYKVRSHK
jgi:hypothetical protein